MRVGILCAFMASGLLGAALDAFARSLPIMDPKPFEGLWYIRAEKPGGRTCQMRLTIRPHNRYQPGGRDGIVSIDPKCIEAIAGPLQARRSAPPINGWVTSTGSVGIDLGRTSATLRKTKTQDVWMFSIAGVSDWDGPRLFATKVQPKR